MARKAFQPTLPARGATWTDSTRWATPSDFNPRSPHGERHGPCHRALVRRVISTHAPRTGSDPVTQAGLPGRRNFNPRSPHGERPAALRPHSLPPPISTHAPRTGSDRTATHKRRRERFQPTLPARGATRNYLEVGRLLCISTHAPRTGSDRRCPPAQSPSSHFNPRSPHGERPSKGHGRSCMAGFQPTLPARGATDMYMDITSSFSAISTHAPRTGSDKASTLAEDAVK